MANKTFNQKLQSLKLQSHLWISFAICVVIALTISFQDSIIANKIFLWLFVTIGAIWWFWLMYVVKNLIDQRINEHQILQEIKQDIKNIKIEIKEK